MVELALNQSNLREIGHSRDVVQPGRNEECRASLKRARLQADTTKSNGCQCQ